MDVVALAEIRDVRHEILVRRERLIALGARLLRLAARVDVHMVGEYDLFAQMADDLVHEQDDRRAEALRVVHRHDRDVVRLAHAPRRERDDGMVAVRAPARLHHICLGGRGRLARRGTDALHVDEHAGDLGAGRVADELLLQREARAARRIHRLRACERGAEDGAHARDLVLHLDELAARLRQELRHRLGDLRRRRDRVAREEIHARGDCALGAGLVALHQSCLAHFAASSILSTKIA